MRSKVVKMLALAFVLGSVGSALAQSPPKPPRQPGGQPPGQPGAPPGTTRKPAPKKSKLEEMLTQALKNNPDIRVAAANLALAEAELNRTRLQVTQKVVMLHQAILSQKAAVDLAQKQYDRYKALENDRAIDSKLVEEQLAKLTVAKAKLAELEAQMPGLLGKVAHAEGDAGDQETRVRHGLEWLYKQQLLQQDEELLAALLSAKNAPKAMGPLAERMRKALETPIKADYKNVTFSELLKELQKQAPGLSFHIRDLPWEVIGRKPGERPTKEEAKVTLHFETPLPIAAILQAIEDQVGAHFIVRDYGILVTSRTDALPPGGITVQEFMRHKPAEKK